MADAVGADYRYFREAQVVPPRNSIWALITRILCPRVGGANRFDGRIEGFCADWLPCSNQTYKSVFARHRDRTRHRSDMIAVCRGEQVGVQAAKSLVTMVESANLWKGDDLACFGALDRPGDRAVLTQGQVRVRERW